MRTPVQVFFDNFPLSLEFFEVVLHLAGGEIKRTRERVEMFTRMAVDIFVDSIALVCHGLESASCETVREWRIAAMMSATRMTSSPCSRK